MMDKRANGANGANSANGVNSANSVNSANGANGDLVLDVQDVVKLEQAIAEAGTSLATLMRRAGTAVAEASRRIEPDETKLIVILAGSGNNGGDGWVAAEQLARAGRDVRMVSMRDPEKIRAQPAHDAAVAACAAGGFPVYVASGDQFPFDVVTKAHVIVDALLGTGFAGSDLRESYANAIRAAMRAHDDGTKLVAVDVPSGLSAQTGKAAVPCIHADLTVTMMVKKPGLLCASGPECCGEIEVADIADIKKFL